MKNKRLKIVDTTVIIKSNNQLIIFCRKKKKYIYEFLYPAATFIVSIFVIINKMLIENNSVERNLRGVTPLLSIQNIMAIW